MPNCYIFIVTDHKEGEKLVKASKVLENRIRYGFWTLGKKSANLKRIEPGSKVAFYQAGKEGGKFVGRCVISSLPYHTSEIEKRLSMGFPSATFDYVVDLRSLKVWEKPKDLEELKEKLEFIKNKKNPRAHFRGSVKSISERDYNRIVG